MHYLACIVTFALCTIEARAESNVTNITSQNGLSQQQTPICYGNASRSVSERCDISQSDHYRLESMLLDNYRPHLRPVWYHRTITNLSLTLQVRAIHEVNEMYQTFRQYSFLQIDWTDEFLRWNPDHFNGIRDIELPTDKIWFPFLVFSGTIQGSGTTGPEDSAFALVMSDGAVTWVPVGIQETLCSMDITFYPFDTQVCDVVIELWSSDDRSVNIVNFDATPVGSFQKNSEWHLMYLETEFRNTSFKTKTFDVAVVRFHLKRRRLFHCLTLIVPNVLLAILAAFVFKLPEESGEKLSYSMPLLLAFTLNLTVLINTMPRSSLKVSLLVIYLTSLSIITALSIIATVMNLRLYHRHEVLQPAAQTAIRLLAKFFCFKSPNEILNQDNDTATRVFDALPKKFSPAKFPDALVGVSEETADEDERRAEGRVPSKDEAPMTGKDAAVVLDNAFFYVFMFLNTASTFFFIATIFAGQ